MWEEINFYAAQHRTNNTILKSQNIILEKNVKDEERIETHTSHIKKIEEEKDHSCYQLVVFNLEDKVVFFGGMVLLGLWESGS